MKYFRYILLTLPLLLAACGYGFGEQGQSVLSEQDRTLAIAEVKNPTTISWLEPRIRRILRDELTRRGIVKWVDSRSQADALITINIEKFYRPTTVSGEKDQTLQSSANFVFSAEIKSATDGSVLWNSGSISQSWPFFSGQEAEADKEVTLLGIRRLADRMSQNY
ncbi:LPS assembly lipoprotein LptE [uncultured Pseudodesulfovibrio sp.]|uniref:LPS assembly lipoprotein LptE n=1 Tax=uncultured Pseudodesulfovibrio sp. TaxID=2035858 RepID=UPI0029C77988|nr:LPS assembly lipoprotein LptE [uncultured Pseudodesulfovibrio sp.]